MLDPRIFGNNALNPQGEPNQEFDGLEANTFIHQYARQFVPVQTPDNTAAVELAFRKQDFEDAELYVAPTQDVDVVSPSDFNDGRVTKL